MQAPWITPGLKVAQTPGLPSGLSGHQKTPLHEGKGFDVFPVIPAKDDSPRGGI
jgi:hypothetical protein